MIAACILLVVVVAVIIFSPTVITKEKDKMLKVTMIVSYIMSIIGALLLIPTILRWGKI